MKLVLEGGDDPEVAAAASDAPEQVLVLLRARPQQLSVGGRHVGGDQVVARQSITAVQPAQPAAEREPGDTGHRHDSERRRQPERLRGAVELCQGEPGFGPDCPRLWIDPDGFHAGQVDHHGAVAHGVPGDAVTASAHREREVMSTCERDAAEHVGRIHTPDDGERAPIDHAVEHARGPCRSHGRRGRPPRPADQIRAPDEQNSRSRRVSRRATPLRLRSHPSPMPTPCRSL